jgi:hypothetical protein
MRPSGTAISNRRGLRVMSMKQLVWGFYCVNRRMLIRKRSQACLSPEAPSDPNRYSAQQRDETPSALLVAIDQQNTLFHSDSRGGQTQGLANLGSSVLPAPPALAALARIPMQSERGQQKKSRFPTQRTADRRRHTGSRVRTRFARLLPRAAARN